MSKLEMKMNETEGAEALTRFCGHWEPILCRCNSTARIPAFQAGYVGSIPITCSKMHKTVTDVNRRTISAGRVLSRIDFMHLFADVAQ